MKNHFDTIEESIEYVETNGSVYEFGTYSGRSAYRIINTLQKRNFIIDAFYGFDSFTGLPKEQKGIWRPDDWKEGNFNAAEDIGVQTTEEVIKFIYNQIGEIFPSNKLFLISGWFSDTLNLHTFNKYKMNLASYIHVDCDLYISSYQALKFIFETGIVGLDTIIRFDDILSSGSGSGQKLAITKITQEFQVEFDQLSLNCFKVYQYDLSKMVTKL